MSFYKKHFRKYKWILICIVIIALSNWTPINFFIHEFEVVDMLHYSYSNSDDPSTIFHENFGSPFNFRTTVSDEYRITHPNNDTLLYRNFWKNPVCFWRWKEYLTDQKYTLPYISREDVSKNATIKMGKY
jgi:hypothetical protein